ncbi:unnamed protein product [Staurois parvus]|uniref:Uncharacterized protein n=1 Tax=Staurois parvus TaxID=386267 RepID=A0ABN9HWB0_9NEOB|nr:unnamed protein product [Staurois parvus]
MYTDHQSTDDQSPAAPPVSVHQCQLCVHPCHLNATYSAHLSCLSVPPTNASQCHLSVPVSVA